MAFRWFRALEPWWGVLLALGYLGWLLTTTASLGYARDEGFYFYAAERYQTWFELLWQDPGRALDPAVVDYHWAVNREHPAFIKTLLALSHGLLFEWLGLFTEAGTAYRFVGMLSASVMLATVYAWGRTVLGTGGALAAVLALALMPRVFHHAHLSCFDVPVAALWLLVCFAYSRSLTDQRWRWALFTGLSYGLLLNTKHNSWLLPPLLLLHFVVVRFGSRRMPGMRPSGKGLVCMILFGPPLLVLTWPWLWHDTLPRFVDYVRFHTGHEYYNMEFLGRTYYEPPMPRAYAPVMTLATVPGITLTLCALGLWRAGGTWLATRRVQSVSPESWQRATIFFLWGLCMLGSYAPWLSSRTPIFGGTKHWLTAYPFMALFAGLGFSVLLERLDASRSLRRHRPLAAGALALLLVAAPLTMTIQSHPYGLSAYTPLVGGAPGAASLGLNRGFWGYTTGSLAAYLNQEAPGGASVYLHDTARSSFAMLQRDRRVREDLRPTLDIASSNIALYHHEPHMGRVEYQIWVDYGTLRPAVIGSFQGVPIVWAYRRPQ